ncbi:MAG: four helix bundle protein [Candidatus Moranbacteria bacterium]|nr:four helix bundle protein [Candidatus Moranbacteria bacterium]
MSKFSTGYDLEERTAKFGESVIELCKDIRQDAITRPTISQTVRSSTSIGANYCEANNASSRKDFKNKIFICKKETQETKHWLRMLATCAPEKKVATRKLWQEAHELSLIFQKITNTLLKEK